MMGGGGGLFKKTPFSKGDFYFQKFPKGKGPEKKKTYFGVDKYFGGVLPHHFLHP